MPYDEQIVAASATFPQRVDVAFGGSDAVSARLQQHLAGAQKNRVVGYRKDMWHRLLPVFTAFRNRGSRNPAAGLLHRR